MSHVHSVASMYPSHITYTLEYRCCSLRSLILESWIPTFLVWKKAFKLFFEGHLAMPLAVSSADFLCGRRPLSYFLRDIWPCLLLFPQLTSLQRWECLLLRDSFFWASTTVLVNLTSWDLHWRAMKVSVLLQVLCEESKQESIALQLSNARLGA